MAYTKAPVNDTHNVIRVPTIGSPIVVSDSSAAVPTTLNFIDCFTRKEPQWATDPINRVHKRDGYTAYEVGGSSNTSGNLGACVVLDDEGNNAWVGRNTDIIKIASIGATNAMTATVFQSSVTNAYDSFGTTAINNSNENIICLLTSAKYLLTWKSDGTGYTTTDLTGIGVSGLGNLVFLDGYLFAVNLTNGRIYNSTVGGVLTTWSSIDYTTPEIYPDRCQWIDKHKNHLVAFGNSSVEFFYDAGIEVGSPLARQESYTSRVGIVIPNLSGRVQKATASIDDDLYFIGINPQNAKSLYRIHNFQVQEIPNYYVNNFLNHNTISRIQSVVISNDPMIMISGGDGNIELMYNPKEDNWWMLRSNTTSGTPNTDFPGAAYRLGSMSFYSPTYQNSTILAVQSTTSTTLYGYIANSSVTVSSDVYTEIIDLGINYYKHIARVDAVGDYGNNTLTLAYNGTPNYSQSYTSCTPTRTPSSAGYGYNASWYNLGAFRRFGLKLTMSGTNEAIHTGFDIEYNAGAT